MPLDLPEDFATSAAYPLFRLDPPGGSAQVLHFAREDYLRVAFLDERALGHRPIGGWNVPIAALRERVAAAGAARVPAHWLFHLGHCGSTLLSRLLDAVPGVLGLREPLPLLTLAELQPEAADPERRLDGEALGADLRLVLRLLRRGFADTRAVLVKPTSVVTALAPRLLAADEDARAVLLGVGLETWLATMLRDPGLRQAARSQAALRIAAWRACGGDPAVRLSELSDAELLALSWLAEQLRWRSLAQRFGARLLRIDFDAFLAAPLTTLTAIAQHYRLGVTPEAIASALRGGLLDRYAKDPRQPYDAGTRARELADAERRFGDEIARGTAWAEAAIDRHDWGEAIAGIARPLR